MIDRRRMFSARENTHKHVDQHAAVDAIFT
jgi:hypothetical protein